MATKYEILKCDAAPAGGWIVRVKASDPELSKTIFVEKEAVFQLPADGDRLERALAAIKASGWKAVLDRKLANALSISGLIKASKGEKLEKSKEVSL